MSDPNCIFCKIVAGQIPCHRAYEDEHVLAFLDIGPLSPGHTLVILKEHWVKLDEVSEEAGAAIGRVLPRLSRAVKAATGIADWNILQNNGKAAHQDVGHVHFHVIPKPGTSGGESGGISGAEALGLGISWPAGKLENEKAKKLVEAIRASL